MVWMKRPCLKEIGKFEMLPILSISPWFFSIKPCVSVTRDGHGAIDPFVLEIITPVTSSNVLHNHTAATCTQYSCWAASGPSKAEDLPSAPTNRLRSADRGYQFFPSWPVLHGSFSNLFGDNFFES